MAIGAPNNDINRRHYSDDAGHVRIYHYDGATWTQLGGDIDGDVLHGNGISGYSVSLSADGTTVAIGAPNNDGPREVTSGKCEVAVVEDKCEQAAVALGWIFTISGNLREDREDRPPGCNLVGSNLKYNFNTNSLGSCSSNSKCACLEADDAGHVRIYHYEGATWKQLGGDIYGEAAGDQSGSSVSLSANGTTVAIGAPNNDGNPDPVYFELTSGFCQGQGKEVITSVSECEAADKALRWSFVPAVIISSGWPPGCILVNGNLHYNTYDSTASCSSNPKCACKTLPKAGHVRIYRYEGATWTQLGGDIDGEAAGDQSGSGLQVYKTVSLSADGTTVAIGAPNNDGNGTDAGHVRIYHYERGTWTQLGGDIDGEAAGDYSGASVSLSADGTTVAIGAYNNDGNGNAYPAAGHVRIYHYEGGTWTQLFGDIDGEAAGDYSGSVSLSAYGTTVAIGAYNNDDAGHVRIYGLLEGRVVLQESFDDFPPGCSTTNGDLRLNTNSPTIACSEDHKCLCKRRGIDSFTNRSPEVCRKKQFYKSANYYRSENICDSDSTLNASECAAAAVELRLSELTTSIYTEVTSGKCSSSITSVEECEQAAVELGWSDVRADYNTGSEVPPGCYFQNGNYLVYNRLTTSTTSCSDFRKCACLDTTPVPNGCIMHVDGHVTHKEYSDVSTEDYCTYKTGKECICKSDGLDREKCAAATGLDLADLTHKDDYGTYYRSNTTCNTSDSFDNAQECKIAAEWLKSNRPTFPLLTDIDPQFLKTDTIVPKDNTNTCFLDGNNFYWKNNHLDYCGDGGCVCKRNDLPKGCSTYNSKAYWSDNSNDNPNEKYHKVDIIPNTNFIIDSGSYQINVCVEKNKEFKFGVESDGFTRKCLAK